MALLVEKYRDPDRPGLLNYLNLHHDMVALGEQMARQDVILPRKNEITDYLPPTVCKSM